MRTHALRRRPPRGIDALAIALGTTFLGCLEDLGGLQQGTLADPSGDASSNASAGTGASHGAGASAVSAPGGSGAAESATTSSADAASIGASSATAGGGGGSACGSGPGPQMVDMGGWCIDSTEVTRSDYAAFVAAAALPQSVTGPPYCSANLTYLPAGAWPPSSSEGDLPVVFVDWCDAYAYCAWAGKRLCGAIGGGPSPLDAFDNPASSQWDFACSAAGTTKYPYGNAYGPTVCVGSDYDGVSGLGPSDSIRPVGEASDCHGLTAPFDTLRDMSGNVAEWEDSCTASLGDSDKCRRRGGSYSFGPGGDLRCADTSASTRDATSPATGFRCCSP